MRRALFVLAISSMAAPAWARSEKTEPFDAAQIFPTAVRFLRIDANVKIVEKDADAGYVLFDLTEDKHVFRGALELVKTEVDGREAVRLVLRIDDRPEYEEELILEKLDAKIRSELGHPKKAPPRDEKKRPPADDGKPDDRPADPGAGPGTGSGG